MSAKSYTVSLELRLCNSAYAVCVQSFSFLLPLCRTLPGRSRWRWSRCWTPSPCSPRSQCDPFCQDSGRELRAASSKCCCRDPFCLQPLRYKCEWSTHTSVARSQMHAPMFSSIICCRMSLLLGLSLVCISRLSA